MKTKAEHRAEAREAARKSDGTAAPVVAAAGRSSVVNPFFRETFADLLTAAERTRYERAMPTDVPDNWPGDSEALCALAAGAMILAGTELKGADHVDLGELVLSEAAEFVETRPGCLSLVAFGALYRELLHHLTLARTTRERARLRPLVEVLRAAMGAGSSAIAGDFRAAVRWVRRAVLAAHPHGGLARSKTIERIALLVAVGGELQADLPGTGGR